MENTLYPLIAAAFAFTVWQGYRLCALHRRFWGISLFSPRALGVKRLVYAAAAGALLSAVFFWGGWSFRLTAADVWWVWGVTALLGLVRLRWMAFHYAAALVSLLALGFSLYAPTASKEGVTPFVLSALADIDVAHLLLLAGLLSALAGVLAIVHGHASHLPLLLPHRGRAIGTFVLQSVWAVPLLLQTEGGWLLFPAMLVHADRAVVRHPQPQARLRGLQMLGFGLILAALAWTGAAAGTPSSLWAGTAWALLGQGAITSLSRRREARRAPRYRLAAGGIRVLAVKAGSPAAEMGVIPGEIITHANGQAVRTMTDLYTALRQSSAFCKLEVMNEKGEPRFAQRSLYADEPHELGIVAVDDVPQSGPYPHQYGWWRLLTARTQYRRRAPARTLDQ